MKVPKKRVESNFLDIFQQMLKNYPQNSLCAVCACSYKNSKRLVAPLESAKTFEGASYAPGSKTVDASNSWPRKSTYHIISPQKVTISKGKIVFQPSMFKGYMLVFRRVSKVALWWAKEDHPMIPFLWRFWKTHLSKAWFIQLSLPCHDSFKVSNSCFCWIHLDVSKNNGTPKSSILIGFSIINHPFWGVSLFLDTSISSFPTPSCWAVSMEHGDSVHDKSRNRLPSDKCHGEQSCRVYTTQPQQVSIGEFWWFWWFTLGCWEWLSSSRKPHP